MASQDDVKVWVEELIEDIRAIQIGQFDSTGGRDNYVELLELAIEVLDDELNAENIANSVVSEA